MLTRHSQVAAILLFILGFIFLFSLSSFNTLASKFESKLIEKPKLIEQALLSMGLKITWPMFQHGGACGLSEIQIFTQQKKTAESKKYELFDLLYEAGLGYNQMTKARLYQTLGRRLRNHRDKNHELIYWIDSIIKKDQTSEDLEKIEAVWQDHRKKYIIQLYPQNITTSGLACQD